MSFKVTVKNGTLDYKWNTEKNAFGNKRMDQVDKFDTLAEALAEFLYVIEDHGIPSDEKVTLTYIPAKKDKK